MDKEQYQGLFSLQDKVVMVAGGAGGIGAEMVSACAAFGARVAVAELTAERANEAAARLGTPDQVIGVAVNITKPETLPPALGYIEKQFGIVDVVINAAGTHIEQPAEDFTPEAWDTVVNLNLRGAFMLSQAVARPLIAHKKGGSIIHVTSVRSALGIHRGYAAYCASKGGLSILIKQLATEWAKYQIRVNGIAPTFTRTSLVADYLNDPIFYGNLVNRIPLGRVCETTDLAGTAIFLASNASSFITGQNLFVDGGVTASQ
ncbi:MAG: SDR family oxidoreductase [Chloroflexi bacterium]|nr:SDR family oxidoreductase [Chloroflexota bacterium]